MLSLLLPLHILCAIRAVFGIVGRGLKCLAADGTAFCGVISKNLRFQRLPLIVLQQYMPEHFAVDGVGNALDTDTRFPVIQHETIAVVIVAAKFSD